MKRAAPTPEQRRPPRELRAGDRVGEYLLEAEIGEGTCGIVWRAGHRVLPNIHVALKIPRDASVLQTLEKESLKQHALDHPGILRIEGVCLDGPVPYVAQEYASGGDLKTLLARDGAIPLKRAMKIFAELVDMLCHAHSRGVVHRDLKSANVLFDSDGRVRLGDFGLGEVADVARAASRRIERGARDYVAPDMPRDEKKRRGDASVDVFALGVILFEMLTGGRPVGRVGLEKISLTVDEIFSRCWAPRADRHADANELRIAIDKLTTAGQKLRKKPRQSTFRPSRFRWFVRAVLIPMLLLSSLGYTVWHYEFGHGSRLFEVVQRDSRAFDEPSRDEADRLRDIRLKLERDPTTRDGARALLAEFRSEVSDEGLVETAKRWEELLPTGDEPELYAVTWERFHISRKGYRESVVAAFEFGRPDVYLRVERVRDGTRELVYSSSSSPIESWSEDWTSIESPHRFSIQWESGDELRVELWDQDRFGDNKIASWELSGELSILLLSGALTTEDGHGVELRTDLGFGDAK